MQLLPVSVVGNGAADPAAALPPAAIATPGRDAQAEVVLRNGRVLRVPLDADALRGAARRRAGGMIAPPAGVRVWLAAGTTDMRRGRDGLAALVQQALGAAPFSGHVFVFRGRRGHLVKVLW